MDHKKYIRSVSELANFNVIDLRSEDDFKNGRYSGGKSFSFLDSKAVKFLSKNGFANGEGKSAIAQSKVLVNQIESIAPDKDTVLLCNDGGIRSKLIWETLRLTHSTFIFKGGYREFRRQVNAVFNNTYILYTLSGKTGSGKTDLLDILENKGCQIINLEKIATHQGSVFGNLKSNPQPTQQQFENNLALELLKKDETHPVIVEWENMNVGQVSIPTSFWDQITKGVPIYINTPKDERINRLVGNYAGINDSNLKDGILFLREKLGAENTQALINHLANKDYKWVAEGLLDHFDNAVGYSQTNIKTADLAVDGSDINRAAFEILEYLKRKSPGDRGH